MGKVFSCCTKAQSSPQSNALNTDQQESYIPPIQNDLVERYEDKARLTQRGVAINIVVDNDLKIEAHAELLKRNDELTMQKIELQEKLKKLQQKVRPQSGQVKFNEHTAINIHMQQKPKIGNQQLHNENLRLKNQISELQKNILAVQNRLLDLTPNAVSLLSDFPLVEDIVIRYDTLRGQNRTNCSKKIKKYLKKQPENANAEKHWIIKQTNKLLFEILINCHNKMRNYYILVNKQYDNNDMNGMNNEVYLKLRQEFSSLFNHIKNDYTNDIIKKQIERKYENIYNFCDKQQLMEFIEECLYICWFINVCKSPPLLLHPIIFDNKDKYTNDDIKENITDDILLKNNDNRDLYEYVAGSEEDQALNYYVWPAIIRIDTQFALSRIHAFFMNDIPKNKS